MPGNLTIFQTNLGYGFQNSTLLQQALDHRAFKTENGIKTRHFEHLEFLGDRALNLCIATILSELHPTWTPGELQTVYIHYTRNTDDDAKNGGPLYRIAKELDLEAYLTLPQGMQLDKAGKRGKAKKRGDKTKEWILSDHMEAIFGAIYVDAKYDLQKLLPIVKHWFSDLGLLNVDHDSISNFGASQSALNHLYDIHDDEHSDYDQFIEWITRGNLEKLQTNAVLQISNQQLVYALLAALANNRTNVVPYLIKSYTFDLEAIRDALEDDALPISSKRYLEDFLIVQSVEAYRNNRLNEHETIELFFSIVQQSNVSHLEKCTFNITETDLKQGFDLALNKNNTHMICYLVKKYAFSKEFLQEKIDSKTLSPTLEGFIVNHLKKRSALSTVSEKSTSSQMIPIVSTHHNSLWQSSSSSDSEKKTSVTRGAPRPFDVTEK